MSNKSIPLQEGWEMMSTGGIIRTGGLQFDSSQSVALTPVNGIPAAPKWEPNNAMPSNSND